MSLAHPSLVVGVRTVVELGLEEGDGDVLREAVAEEQAACFDGGAEEGRGDATVEGEEAVAGEALAEAVEWACVAEGGGGGLGL